MPSAPFILLLIYNYQNNTIFDNTYDMGHHLLFDVLNHHFFVRTNFRRALVQVINDLSVIC